MYVWTQRAGGSTHRTCTGASQRGSQGWEGKWMWGSLCSKGKQSVYSNGVLPSISTTFRASSMLGSRWPTQINPVFWFGFCEPFSLFWLFCFFVFLFVGLFDVCFLWSFGGEMNEDRTWSWVIREDPGGVEGEKNRLGFCIKFFLIKIWKKETKKGQGMCLSE